MILVEADIPGTPDINTKTVSPTETILFYMVEEQPDMDPPEFVSAIALPDLVTVTVTFNEPIVDDETSTDEFNWFFLTSDGLSEIPVMLVSIDGNEATLTLRETRDPAQSYRIEVENNAIFDLAGNAIVAPNNFIEVTTATSP